MNNLCILVFGFIYSKYKFFAAGFSLVAIFAVWLFLEKTPYGAIIKAGAHDSEMVRALGQVSRSPRWAISPSGASASARRKCRTAASGSPRRRAAQPAKNVAQPSESASVSL